VANREAAAAELQGAEAQGEAHLTPPQGVQEPSGQAPACRAAPATITGSGTGGVSGQAARGSRAVFALGWHQPVTDRSDALVSGALVPFGPARRDPPLTTVRLPGGVDTYRGLRRCAAELVP
jgi:hypothetical protein